MRALNASDQEPRAAPVALPVSSNVFRADLNAFQVPSRVLSQHSVIKSNLLLEDALDIWLHQKNSKTPRNAIGGKAKSPKTTASVKFNMASCLVLSRRSRLHSVSPYLTSCLIVQTENRLFVLQYDLNGFYYNGQRCETVIEKYISPLELRIQVLLWPLRNRNTLLCVYIFEKGVNTVVFLVMQFSLAFFKKSRLKGAHTRWVGLK